MSAATDTGARLAPASRKALARCYDAVWDPGEWNGAMEAVAIAMGGHAACFHPKGAVSRMSLPASNLYRDMLREFSDVGWNRLDLRGARGWQLVESGRSLVVEDDVTTPEERKRLPIYRDFFARRDMTGFAGIGFVIDGHPWSVNVMRSEELGPLTAAERENLIGMRPHFARFLRFSNALAHKAGTSAMAALEQVEQPAIILDPAGRVFEANPGARALFGRDFDTREGRLVARDRAANSRLDAMIFEAIRATGACDVQGKPVLIPRENARPLVVEAVPARGIVADAFGMMATMLLINDLDRRTAPDTVTIRSVFGLTRREAEVAAALAQGDPASVIAASLSLKLSSVRHLIKAVLAKTGTNRQSDVVSLMSRIRRRGN